MTYKVVRDAQNKVICFGPNDDNYEPTIASGQSLSIENKMPTIPVPYQDLRAAAYPPMADYLDAIVKGDAGAQQAYIDKCLTVKAKFPKI